jgi:hypothetical protein
LAEAAVERGEEDPLLLGPGDRDPDVIDAEPGERGAVPDRDALAQERRARRRRRETAALEPGAQVVGRGGIDAEALALLEPAASR